jgi:septal ring factor EnvC (AmiA/AmiB activator)
MRALREQPRIVAAKLSISLAALIVALVVGSALASDGSDTPPDLRPALERSERLRRDQSGELRKLTGRVARLRADLRTATRRARAGARARERLGRELREARRRLARERQP